MGRRRRVLAWSAMGLVLLLLGVFFGALPPLVDAALNRVLEGEPVEVPAPAAELHREAFVADLHDDFFLWSRGFLERSGRGHTDLPRLRAGGMDLQVFAAVTQVPWGLNYEENPSDSDLLPLLTVAQRWPVATWTSPFARALHVAGRAERAAERAGDRFRLVRSRAQLEALEAGGEDALGGLLAIEGLHAAEGEIEKIDRLFERGYRMFGLAHFFDNAFSGSAHGVEKGGLTELGRKALRRVELRGGVIDLAHGSPAAIEDALAVARGPVVVSHTGVKATCPGPRNLTDAQLRAVAETGGVVGIGFWDGAVCGEDVDAIVRAFRHAAEVAGPEHVALGSDFDGSTAVPFDAAGLPQLTAALRTDGFSEAELRGILGGNLRRVLHAALPADTP